MAVTTAIKLTNKQLGDLLSRLRSKPDWVRKDIAPLIHHINWQAGHIVDLERENERLRAPKLPTMPDAQKGPMAKQPVLTLHERIYEGIKNNESDSKGFKLMLEFNKISEERAFEIYNEQYAARHKD